MPDNASRLLSPSTEDQRIAAKNFEYAHRAAVGGNFDLAIQCLRISCKLVPANLSYRQALRKAEKSKYKDNLRGSLLAPLTTFVARARLRRAMQRGDYLAALEHGEAILARSPWDKSAQLQMAEAASALDLPVVAMWVLHQAREKNVQDLEVNRALARLLEHQGHFTQAIQIWEMVRRLDPKDVEAQDKAKHLGATDTINRGKYEEVTSGAPAVASPAKKTPVPATKPPVKPKPAESGPGPVAPVTAAEYLQRAAQSTRNGDFDEARAILDQGLAATNRAIELTFAREDLEIEPLRRALTRTEEQSRAQPQDDKLTRACEELRAQINARELVWYRRKTEHDPSDGSNRFELGLRLLRAGRVEEAISELQAARSDARLQWKALLHLGHCFKARENWLLARRNFEEALRLIPEGEKAQRKDLLFHLAEGHAAAGDLERAIALALDLADQDYAYRNIGRLLEEWQGRARQGGAARATGQ
jgi:tetratricopeptide (TPR) repeat protein